jgi:hypothetical protein
MKGVMPSATGWYSWRAERFTERAGVGQHEPVAGNGITQPEWRVCSPALRRKTIEGGQGGDGGDPSSACEDPSPAEPLSNNAPKPRGTTSVMPITRWLVAPPRPRSGCHPEQTPCSHIEELNSPSRFVVTEAPLRRLEWIRSLPWACRDSA